MIRKLLVSICFCLISASANAQSAPALNEQIKILDEKISVTKNEIAKIRDASYLPDLYFALADMHVQKARAMYLLKVKKNPGRAEAEIDFSAEKRPKQEAIDIYQKIYSFFPKEKRRDRALFLKGLEQRDLGQFEQMLRTFSDLDREFPESPHYNEASIIVGDFLLDQKKDAATALTIYHRVTERPLSAFTPIAHLRKGNCYVALSAFDRAMPEFEAAIAKQDTVNSDELPELFKKENVKRDALLAMAIPYVDLYSQPERKDFLPPVDYFREKSPDHFTYRQVLSRAGRRLIMRKKWKDAADSFFHVSVLATDFDTRFEALQRVNDAQKEKPEFVEILPFVREIAATIDLLQAQVEKPMVLTAQALIEFDKETSQNKGVVSQKPMNKLIFLELLLRDFSTQLHKKARASGSPEDFKQVAEAYQTYLDRFPTAPKALDIHYNLAEAYFKSDDLVDAGIHYELLSKDQRLRKRASLFQDSAIESYTKALQKIETLSAVEKIRARRGLREVGAAWIAGGAPKQAAATVAFNIANSWYEERNLKKAIDGFRGFVRSYPRDQRVRDAVFLIINSYSQLDDFTGLRVAGAELGKTPGLSAGDRATIQDAIRRAQTKQLQTIAGDYGTKEYAQNLLSVASKYKGSALGVQALYEAFSSMKSKHDPELFEVGEALLDQHAESQYAKEVASSMATLALSTASYDRAARYLERFADKYPREKESFDFRKTAAVLYERQGDFKKARAQFSKLGDRLKVAQMDLALNDWPALEKSSRESGAAEAKYWYALSLWRQKRLGDALPLLKALANDRSASLDQKGHAKFLLLQEPLASFQAIQMKSADDQKSLGEKVKSFQSLSAQISADAKLGAGRWAIADLYLLGQIHYDLGRFIAGSPIPKGLSSADRKTYVSELNKQASGYLAEASKVFSACVATAETNDVFTRYVDGCRAKGKKLVREEEDLVRAPARTGEEPARAKEIRRALFKRGQDQSLLFALGEAYLKSDQPQAAAGVFSRILELNPSNARALASLGVADLYQNNVDGAFDSFRRALAADARDATALWNLAGMYKQFGFTTKLGAIRGRMTGMKRPALVHEWAKGL